jgi:hypothetical protein
MSDLTARLRARLAFDESLDSSDGDDDRIKYLYEPRLAPLFEKLIAAVSACEQIAGANLADIDDRDLMAVARKALSAIRAEVET